MTQMTTTTSTTSTTPTPASLLVPTPSPAPLPLPAPASSSVPRAPRSTLPSPRARKLFEFCAKIVICASISLMVWIGEACTTRDPGLRRIRLLKRYVFLTLKVLRTVQDKPERLTLAQLAWLRRVAKIIQSLFGRPLDFSPLAGLAQPAKPAKPENLKSPGDPNRPDSLKHSASAQRRPASSDSCPPVPDQLDDKYVKAPGQVLATVCTNLVRLMSRAPIQPVRERMKRELEIAQKEADPQQVSELGRAAFTRSSFAFILPLPATSPVTSPVPYHHPPP